ncbi:MAG: peroxiredoxin [Candidatus Eremiobacteraeota bacterium]|nr:peroxiredoxin [Candidatus Eremiobacteraeota bacterium]
MDDTGASISLASLTDEYLVLYFYPKDDTPGCTSEGTQFRDAAKAFAEKKARIVGVSRDSVVSHQKFKTKYDLPFTLLADSDQAICDAFDVIGEKNMYGKKVKGVIRSTFVIDTEGRIRKVWPKVKVDGHVSEVLASIT